MVRVLAGLVVFLLWLYCLVSAASAPEHSVRNLPKLLWVLIVLFFPLVGSVAWLIAGRPLGVPPLTRQQGSASAFPEYDRPGRFSAADPQQDAEFLRQVRERAEEQRRREQAQRDAWRRGETPEPESNR